MKHSFQTGIDVTVRVTLVFNKVTGLFNIFSTLIFRLIFFSFSTAVNAPEFGIQAYF